MEHIGKITERSLYPALKTVFNRFGAQAVQEIYFGTQPDLIVSWLDESWLISVKIGDPGTPRLLRTAFTQYIAHMLDSGIKYGMIIFFPESIRKTLPKEEAILKSIETQDAYFLVMNPQLELRCTLAEALEKIKDILSKKIQTSFSLKTVLKLLREHIEELMANTAVSQSEITKIIVNPELFFGISYTHETHENVFKFLATYIFLSQVLFLRLYSVEHPGILKDINLKNLDRKKVEELFNRILEINYRPIFDVYVINAIPEKYIKLTFRLIWGLQIEKIRFELPGRMFHALMPEKIRKLLSAFYTRPMAANLLAWLTIDNPNLTVLDPACGSGTILTAAYRRKLTLAQPNQKDKKLHKMFCENHLFGIDIMPFAVHLTGANLAAMNPAVTIEKVQVIEEDSLKLSPDTTLRPGVESIMKWIPNQRSPNIVDSYTPKGEKYELKLKSVDVILMNPPFTKVERGIKEYIKMDRFAKEVGGEVGLWGHFIPLADNFLKEGGTFGAVLPINLLRGRESKLVRKIIFEHWLPLYIIKPTLNYGFSEWAEYRDILVIAKKTKEKPNDHKVKFCLIKKDLNELTEKDIEKIALLIKETDSLRSNMLDIDSYNLDRIMLCPDNLMPFISGHSFTDKDVLKQLINKSSQRLLNFPKDYFREGYRPVPEGVSKFMFITRPENGRIQESFLILEKENIHEIIASSPAKIQKFIFPKSAFLPTLRTPVGLNTIDITGKQDYIVHHPYKELPYIQNLTGFSKILPPKYWKNIKYELQKVQTNIVVVRRINPFSPNQNLIAFFSETPIYPSNQVNVILEKNIERAKALAVLLNSIFFLANFFNLKEESTGRYIDIRFYDLYAMRIFPKQRQIPKLVEVFEQFKKVQFPALTQQLDRYFGYRYKLFWLTYRKKQKIEHNMPRITPHSLRIKFDTAIAKAIGINISKKELLAAYSAIVNDMIITRGLGRD